MKLDLEILSSCLALTGSIVLAHGFFIRGMGFIQDVASTKLGSNPFVIKDLYYGFVILNNGFYEIEMYKFNKIPHGKKVIKERIDIAKKL